MAVILLRRLVTFRVDLAGIELAALFRIGQDIVRALDILECLFRRSIAGVEIRMMLLRKRPVGLANDFRRCVARDAENGIQVGFFSSQNLFLIKDALRDIPSYVAIIGGYIHLSFFSSQYSFPRQP